LHQPVGAGITPGSGPGHLGLFGYDPIEYDVGRGILSALGIDFDLHTGRCGRQGNFCTLDAAGQVTDRRAGRQPTHRGRELCDKLSGIKIDAVEFIIRPVKKYRFLLVMRGDGLSADVTDTDPHRSGVEPQAAEANSEKGRKTAALINRFVTAAGERLQEEDAANGILLRGFGSLPDLPNLADVTKMRCKAIAAYPMYRGVSRLIGMEVIENSDVLDDKHCALKHAWDTGDFFFVHIKKTHAYGEDGDFEAKREWIEAVDNWLPQILELEPDVLVVTGDHSTPASLSSHSWHPVPVLLHAPKTVRPDAV